MTSLLCPWCGSHFPSFYLPRDRGKPEDYYEIMRPRVNFKKHYDKCKKKWDENQPTEKENDND